MKWIIIAVAAVVVIGSGVGAYVLLKGSNDSSGNSASSTTSGESSSNSSIADLVAGGKSAKCSYTLQNGDNTTNGTMYVAGGKKLYGVLTSTVKGTTAETYIIRNGDTQYMWTKGTSAGYKSSVSANSSSNSSNNNQTTHSVDTSKKYDFKCSSWTVDSSKFTPPSDVTFSDLSAQSSSETAKAAICNALTGAAKTACLNATNQ